MTTLASLAAGEAVLRVVDGYRLTSLALRRDAAAHTPAAATSADERYIERIPLASGVDRAWYRLEPEQPKRFPPDGELARRQDRYKTDSITPLFSFNRRYLQQEACGPSHGGGLPAQQDFFYFEPSEPSPFPTYRHLAHISPPAWFVTNNFGWRGRDIAVNRAADVIRIAFVGASTTVDSYSVPFSHPELVEYWLNRWAAAAGRPFRFEVANTGRSGIDSRSIAAIVRQELVPIDPDLVIFYEGANQFWPGQMMTVRFGRLFPRPRSTFRRRFAAESYLATVNRLLNAFDRLTGGDGGEPRKPPYAANWPAGLDERDPDLAAPVLPMDLKQVVSDLNDMREALKPNGGELAVASFVWLVHDGMRLDLARHPAIHRYLNDTYWPITYAHMRRMADFQNRVFEKVARASDLPFLDIAAAFPQDPDLFDDGIHLKYEGLRLQAWLFVQSLVPIVIDRTESGEWPRPVGRQTSTHPAFDQPDRRLVTLDELKASCS
jgi:hypothetical protein